tara:strand:- start:6079 stop:7449 length:1371 start_codon:yes stop_codon:yes gene_type:complete
MSKGYINTMTDLEAATYGVSGVGGNALLKQAGAVANINSAYRHDTGTDFVGQAAGLTALYNVLYGQKVWSMLNREVNALSVLSKRPWSSSGWRVLKSRPSGGSGSTFGIGTTDLSLTGGTSFDALRADKIGGVPENASFSNSEDGLVPMTPEYEQLYYSPKIVAHQFDFSELSLEMAAIDDGVGDIRAIVREDMGKHHAEVQNKMLVMPLEHYDNATYTAIERNYTSLHKVVTSSAELNAMNDGSLLATGSGASTLPDQIVKLYGSTARQLSSGNAVASFLDAEVDFGNGYAAGDIRPLTLTLLNDMIRRLRLNGGSPKVILTGYDTIQTIADLLQSQERFMDRQEIIPTFNGVRGIKGQEVGFRVATYFDIPIIPVKDMPVTKNSGATGGVSDLLFLDTDHLWLGVMKPTQYFEDGITNGNPFGVGTLGNRAMYRTIGEVGCSFWKGQGKITNVK